MTQGPTYGNAHNRGYGADAMRLVKIVHKITDGLTITEKLGPGRKKINARTSLTYALATLARGITEEETIGRLPMISAVGYYLALGASPLVHAAGPFDLQDRDPYEDYKDTPIRSFTAVLVQDMAEDLTYTPDRPVDYYARLCFFYLKVILMAPSWDGLVDVAAYTGAKVGEAYRIREAIAEALATP